MTASQVKTCDAVFSPKRLNDQFPNLTKEECGPKQDYILSGKFCVFAADFYNHNNYGKKQSSILARYSRRGHRKMSSAVIISVIYLSL